MIVLRIENNKGQGPYRFSAIASKYDVNIENYWHGEEDPIKRPVPRFMCPGEVCGFDSYAQLLDWFDVIALKRLHKHGFGLAKYRINKCHVVPEKKQVCFVPTKQRKFVPLDQDQKLKIYL